MKIGAVCVNYRTPNDLKRFLDTWIEYQPRCDWELTVVNVDPTIEDVSAGRAPCSDARWTNRFTHLLETENIGYARACNDAASRFEDCTVLMFFNADIWFTDEAVYECALALELHDDWGILGPRQTNKERRITHAGMFGTHTATAPRGWNAHDTGQYNGIAEAITVAGSAYFVKRSCWDQLYSCGTFQTACEQLGLVPLGAFLPTQHYYEETWCSYHAWAHDWKVIYYGAAHVHHQWHQASPVGGFAEQQMPESKRLFRLACQAHGIPHD